MSLGNRGDMAGVEGSVKREGKVHDYWFYRDDPEGRHVTFSEHSQTVMVM